MLFRITTLIWLSVYVISCSPVYPPRFKVDEDSVFAEMNRIARSEGIEIQGIRQKLADTLILGLTIHLTNVEKLPADSNSMVDLQKIIAQKLRAFLKDTDQYNSFNVYFMYHIINSSVERTGIVFRHTFDKSEL